MKFIGFVSFIDTFQKRSMNFAVELGGQGASNTKIVFARVYSRIVLQKEDVLIVVSDFYTLEN